MSFWPSHLTWSAFWAYCACIMQCTSNINKRSFTPWRACRRTRRIVYGPVSLTAFDRHVAQFLKLVVDSGEGILCSILFCRWSQDWKSGFWTVGNLKSCTSPSWYHLRHNIQMATTADHGFVKQLQKGISGARSDDTKGLKGAILDWITSSSWTISSSCYRPQRQGRSRFQPRAHGGLAMSRWHGLDKSRVRIMLI